MSDLVPPEDIEQLVGARRHKIEHIARATSDSHIVYIMHSQACIESGIDLRKCQYSLALDRGIVPAHWRFDQPVIVWIVWGELLPLTYVRTLI